MSRVFKALDEGDMEENNSEEEDFSDDEDDEMLADEDPDDSIILVQYQTKARRKDLIRKGAHVADSSQKKGRLEIGDPIPG